MSLEKKRRELVKLEGQVAESLATHPAVGLDGLLLASGLMPLGDPSFPLRAEADTTSEVAEQAQGTIGDFRFARRTIEPVLTDLRKLAAALTKTPAGFTVLKNEPLGSEPRSGPRPRRWHLEDDRLSVELFTRGDWQTYKSWSFDPKALGLPPKILAALATYQTLSERRQAQADALNTEFQSVYTAWREHPARKQYDEYYYNGIHAGSPLASEMRRITGLLDDAQTAKADFDAVTSHALAVARRRPEDVADMFRGGPTASEASEAILAARRAIQALVPPSALDPFGPGGAEGFTAEFEPPTFASHDDELAYRQAIRSVSSVLADIESLWERHPVRARFKRVNDVNVERGIIRVTDLAVQVEQLDDLNRRAGYIALEYADGARSAQDALAILESIRNDMAAIPEAWSRRGSPDYLVQCAIEMGRPRPFFDAPPRRLRIDSHELLPALAAVEGEQWLERQRTDVLDPFGVAANRQAWRILRDLGTDAEGLDVSDLLEDGGTIHGEDGRLYEVAADGSVALLSSSADPEATASADSFGIPVR
jgi:hypothetical protein